MKVEGIVVKEFRGQYKHSVGDECQMEKWGEDVLGRGCRLG